MEEIGHTLELEALKVTPQGVYLITEEDEEILLPNKYVPRDLRMGDMIEVFIYNDFEYNKFVTMNLRIKFKELICIKNKYNKAYIYKVLNY